MTKNVIFIDAHVQDRAALIAALPPNSEWFLLDGERDGIAQMKGVLSGFHDLASIQTVSHGSSGALYLGNVILDASTLPAYASALEEIGRALASSGDLLLYGCDVAQGKEGQAFIRQLAQYTGAEVGASTDTTGAAALDGNWTLEATTGATEASRITAADYVDALATTNGTAGDDVFSFVGGGIFNGLAGDDVFNLTGSGATLNGGDANDLVWLSIGQSTFLGATVDLGMTIAQEMLA